MAATISQMVMNTGVKANFIIDAQNVRDFILNEKEQKQLISDLASSPGFMQAMIACSKSIEGREPTMAEVGLWFYSSGYLDCLDYQKKKRIARPFKNAIRDELKKIKK